MKSNSKYRAFTLVELLVVIAIIGILIGMLLPAIQALRESSRRMTCSNRLAKLGMAVSSYQLGWGYFPAGSVDAASPIRSAPKGYHHNWISAVLPDLELSVVHKSIDFSAGVYDAKNAIPRSTAISAIRCPSSANDVPTTSTSYVGISSPVETPIAEDNDGMFMLNRQITENEIPDGIEYTLFAGEHLARRSEDLGWMSGTRSSLRTVDHKFESGFAFSKPSPATLADDPELFVGGLGSAHPAGSHILLGSGRIQFFSDSGDRVVLQQLAHRSDGGMRVFSSAKSKDPLKSYKAPKKAPKPQAPAKPDASATEGEEQSESSKKPEDADESANATTAGSLPEEDPIEEDTSSLTASDETGPSADQEPTEPATADSDQN